MSGSQYFVSYLCINNLVLGPIPYEHDLFDHASCTLQSIKTRGSKVITFGFPTVCADFAVVSEKRRLSLLFDDHLATLQKGQRRIYKDSCKLARELTVVLSARSIITGAGSILAIASNAIRPFFSSNFRAKCMFRSE